MVEYYKLVKTNFFIERELVLSNSLKLTVKVGELYEFKRSSRRKRIYYSPY